MNYKKQIRYITFASLILMISAYLLTTLHAYNRYCYKDVVCSLDNISSLFFGPYLSFFIFGFSLFLCIIPLSFTKEAVYKSWKKFTLWYSPFLLLMLLLGFDTGGGGMSGIGGESIALFLAGLYTFISLIIIIVRSIQTIEIKKEAIDLKENFTINTTPIKLSDTSVIVTAITEAESTQSKKEITETLLSQGFKKKDIEKAFKEIQESKKNSVL